MVTALEEQGGEVVTGHEVTDLREFDGVPAVLLDTTPEAFVAMAGDRRERGLPPLGVAATTTAPGVFKIDWILSEPVPWTNPDVRRAGTDPRRRHPGGDDRRGARRPAQGRLDRQALRAGRPADRASTPPGRPRAATSSGPTCTCRTARTST